MGSICNHLLLSNLRKTKCMEKGQMLHLHGRDPIFLVALPTSVPYGVTEDIP